METGRWRRASSRAGRREYRLRPLARGLVAHDAQVGREEVRRHGQPLVLRLGEHRGEPVVRHLELEDVRVATALQLANDAIIVSKADRVEVAPVGTSVSTTLPRAPPMKPPM